MKRTEPRRAQRVIRWVFRRENQMLTCQLTAVLGGAAYALLLLPHWDRSQAWMETFDSSVPALQRHAEIAATLRESGWTVAAYTDASPSSPDKPRVADRRAA